MSGQVTSVHVHQTPVCFISSVYIRPDESASVMRTEIIRFSGI